MVHVVPAQVKAGKMVLAPIVFPCVLEVAAIRETRIVVVVPWKRWTLVMVWALP